MKNKSSGNLPLTFGRDGIILAVILQPLSWNVEMIPNRIVRYFYGLGYAFARYGHTRFPTFKNGITDFYFAYIEQGHYLNDPSYYPKTYGMN